MAKKYNTYDWAALKAAFIVSEQHWLPFARGRGVTTSTFYAHMRREGWEAARSAFRAKKAEVVQTAALEVARAEVASRFRSSEDIRGEYHDLAAAMIANIKKLFIDPQTGEPRPDAKVSTRMLRDLVESSERLYKMHMGTGGHSVEVKDIKKEGQILVAGATSDQLAALSDEELAKVLHIADQTAALPLPAHPTPVTSEEPSDAS